MLVLSRKVGEKIRIGDDIVIEVTRIKGMNMVGIGITAPPHLKVLRGELKDEGPAVTRASQPKASGK